MTATASAMQDRYLMFPLGDELFGIGIEPISDIIEMQPITPVPDMPPHVKGVINLRGAVIPVLDTRIRMGMPERPYDDRTCVIVVQDNGDPVGLIVDTVAEVAEIPTSEISDPPKYRDHAESTHYIDGIGRRGGRVQILLNTARLLDRSTRASLENARINAEEQEQ